MIYGTPDGQTVRIRTCNDHVLIIVGDSAGVDAKLNIEGTDWLLFVMPEVERMPGRAVSYLLPTKEVETEARRRRQEWLASDPNTKGENNTWNIWFKKDAPAKANDYGTTWAKYRLDARSIAPKSPAARDVGQGLDIKAEVEDARHRIAEAAGVPVEAVKITISFEG